MMAVTLIRNPTWTVTMGLSLWQWRWSHRSAWRWGKCWNTPWFGWLPHSWRSTREPKQWSARRHSPRRVRWARMKQWSAQQIGRSCLVVFCFWGCFGLLMTCQKKHQWEGASNTGGSADHGTTTLGLEQPVCEPLPRHVSLTPHTGLSPPLDY